MSPSNLFFKKFMLVLDFKSKISTPSPAIINILSFSLTNFKGLSFECSKVVIKFPKLLKIRTSLLVNSNKLPLSVKLKSLIGVLMSTSHKNSETIGLKTEIKPDLSIKYK